eukprot:scaffold40234_cov68-Phaeocystis_antarctica.AAC.7
MAASQVRGAAPPAASSTLHKDLHPELRILPSRHNAEKNARQITKHTLSIHYSKPRTCSNVNSSSPLGLWRKKMLRSEAPLSPRRTRL